MKIERTITVDGVDYSFDYMSSCYFFEEILSRGDASVRFAAKIAPMLTQFYIKDKMLSMLDVMDELNDILDDINPLQEQTFIDFHADPIMKILSDTDSYLAETLFNTK